MEITVKNKKVLIDDEDLKLVQSTSWWIYGNFDRGLFYLKSKLGYFVTELEAAKAYNNAALLAYGEFAKLNDIK